MEELGGRRDKWAKSFLPNTETPRSKCVFFAAFFFLYRLLKEMLRIWNGP